MESWNVKMELWTLLILIYVNFHLTKCQVITYDVLEEKPSNTYIGNVAQDANISSIAEPGDLQNMEYRFLSQSNPYSEYFNINERDASLFTARQIDRETICKFDLKCVLQVDVISRTASGNFYRKIQLNIQIIDVNDNYPKFSKGSIDIEVSEGSSVGTSIQIEGAIDADAGIYSVQNYTIVPNNSPFGVLFQKNVDGSSIVKITLDEQLDRETREYYHLQLLAQDGGSPHHSGILNVNVYVSDINDNSPVFKDSNLNVTIDEDSAINSTITFVSATDLDKGDNGKIVYSISRRQDSRIQSLFEINQQTGKLMLRESLIFEPGESYKVIIEASDSAKRPRISQVQITVNVRDTHNNPPQITVDLLSNTEEAEISEHAKLAAPVAHITVFDPDTGSNGRVNCTVDDDTFSMQKFGNMKNYKVEYKVVVSNALNREIKELYKVKVVCEDEGEPRLNASATFHVRIMDENDNYPTFSQNTYIVHTPENNKIGETLFQVTATDIDSGENSKVKYRLENSGYNFQINENTGVISTHFQMDRETVSLIRLRVLAIDGGTNPKTGSADVVVNIEDVNDNAPRIENEDLDFNVPENFGRNVSVGVLFASDKDLKENARVSFSVASAAEPEVPIRVFSNGSIVAVKNLDREMMAKYVFTIVASDHGIPVKRTYANITIYVLDMNDNGPRFVFPTLTNNTVMLSFQTQPNQVIAHMSTTDSDEGLNSKVTYLTPNKNLSHMFQLNSLSGRLVLIRKLTHSDIGKYTMIIYAQDKGTPPKITEGVLHIFVSDQPLEGHNVSPVQQEHKYYLIAIAISCVTCVIAVVIILTICLIKRADRMKMKYRQSHNEGDTNLGFESRKKVSFSIDAPDSPHPAQPNVTSNQLYSALSNQVAGSRLNYQSRYQSDHHERQRRLGTSQSVHFTKHDPDTNSNHSADTNTSDSGRGGSDDMNTSSMFTSSLDFDHDHRLSRTETRQQQNIRYNSLPPDKHLPQERNNYVQSNDFFNLGTINSDVYPKLDSSFSQNGLVPYNDTGNDDSTTTSGSYVLDPEDKLGEVIQPSNRCIV